ncbi:transposase [Fodinibius sp. AD559]|uniref:transposase n=1 Tax=Fodinibius sp. AD559 TaxID=3424179 RepID=UPI004046E845
MQLEFNKVYHLYNRSNNRELLFKKKENYRYFLRKFKVRFENSLSVYAYCLMPTHFHFLIRVETKEIDELRKQIGIHLSSYTKAINKVFDRNGSLFQQHTKAKLIEDRAYLLTLISYIHKNPVRARLVNNLKEWRYSSYLDLAGYRNGSLVNHSIIDRYFSSKEEYCEFSKRTVIFK